jgi:hypothetical protein
VSQRPSKSSARRLLYIAFHFPPLQGSTGIARTLSFARYLREWNWDVTVLTVKPSVYPQIREENYASIPEHVKVVRTLAFDTQRHLALFGRYPALLAMPDKYQSWILFGVLRALRIIRTWRPHAVVSTYPVASAHVIGHIVHKLTGVPWVADFRDPMAQPNYPPEPAIHKAFEGIEQRCFTHAARVLVTTPGAAELYAKRFPHYPREQIVTISNGFDPGMFEANPHGAPPREAPARTRPLQLLHSGLLYPQERDPLPLFDAIAALRNAGYFSGQPVVFQFRASGYEARYAPRIRELGLEGTVSFTPPVSYREAIAEMTGSDGLLVLQADNCNDQIPAKLYEYLYAARPILCLTDPAGDTGQLLKKLGSPHIAPLNDAGRIREALVGFIDAVRRNEAFVVPHGRVMAFSRRTLTGELAAVLDGLVSSGAGERVGSPTH